MIRLGVVDDHPMVADGLAASVRLTPDLQVSWTARSLHEARHHLNEGKETDVVLVDVRLQDGSGLDLLPGTTGTTPAFVVMSSFDRPLYAATAFRRGAAGFLLKLAPLDQIVDAIRRAAAGGLAFEARHLEIVREGPTFTPRELEIIRLVAASHSNDEVGARLGISTKTVEAYLREVFRRHGFQTRTELSVWAEREGWLEDI